MTGASIATSPYGDLLLELETALEEKGNMTREGIDLGIQIGLFTEWLEFANWPGPA